MRVPDIVLRKPCEQLTLDVNCRVTREFHVRLFLGKLLILLAAWVLGAKFDMKDEKPSA